MKRILLPVLLSCLLQPVFSQAKYVGFRIDSLVRAEIANRRIPGLQMVVIKYGIVIKKGNYGFANVEDRLPVTDSTLFSIASMTKAFTCAGILLLMEEGKLKIDDPISKYIDSLPATWNDITLRRLMNHTSGLRDDWDENDLFFNCRNSDSAFLESLKATPLKFQPGEAFSYSCGPFILGLVIEKVSGKSYADFMKQRIFDKLGMSNSRINNPEILWANRATGYRLKNNELVHGRQISPAAQARGDVGILTTVTDMQKWYAALQGNALLRQSSIEQMFSPGILNDSSKSGYGFGWFLNPYRDRALISHGGGFRTGFNSSMEIYPEDGVCIILLCNRFNAHTYLISREILGLFNPDYLPASKLDSLADPDTARTALLKSEFTDIGTDLDSARKRVKELHMDFYPGTEQDLNYFRNVTDFTFIRSVELKNPKEDIFGDLIQGIYIYKVTFRNDPNSHYFSFFMNPQGRLVHIDFEE